MANAASSFRHSGDGSPSASTSVARRYGARAKARLHIAARLMRFRGAGQLDELAFLDAVLGAIRRQSESSQLQLRSLVDWVEAYEAEEQMTRRAATTTIRAR